MVQMEDGQNSNTARQIEGESDKSKPDAQKPKWQNRKYIVDSKVQTVFIGYAVAMGFLFLSLGLVLSSYFERILMIQASGGEGFTTLDISLFVAFLVLITFVVFLGIIVSNRVVGPILKLVRQMETLQETGELKEIQFRKNDYFQEVAVSYNKIIGRIREIENKLPKT